MDGNTSALTQKFTIGKLFKYVLPTIFAVLLASLYTIVDGIFVSNFGGTTAFAAINQVGPIFMIVAAIGFMFGSIADLVVDTASHTVTRGGKTITLSSKEFSLLEYLIRNKGTVLSRENIENNLWNYDYSGGSNVVDVYISYLRRKIDSGFSQKLIQTVWGVGWVLREES